MKVVFRWAWPPCRSRVLRYALARRFASLSAREAVLTWMLVAAACAGALACGDRRCQGAQCEAATAQDTADPATPAEMRSRHFRIALGMEPMDGPAAQSEHYRVRVSLDPTFVGGER